MGEYKDIEDYGIEIKALLGSSTFSAKLTEITTEKGDGLSLPVFRSLKYGWSDMEGETPALHVMGLREETIKDEDAYRWVWFRYAIEVYLTGDDVEKFEKMSNRYAKAIKEVLKTKYPDIGFVDGIDYTPIFKYQDVLYKTCSIRYKLRVQVIN